MDIQVAQSILMGSASLHLSLQRRHCDVQALTDAGLCPRPSSLLAHVRKLQSSGAIQTDDATIIVHALLFRDCLLITLPAPGASPQNSSDQSADDEIESSEANKPSDVFLRVPLLSKRTKVGLYPTHDESHAARLHIELSTARQGDASWRLAFDAAVVRDGVFSVEEWQQAIANASAGAKLLQSDAASRFDLTNQHNAEASQPRGDSKPAARPPSPAVNVPSFFCEGVGSGGREDEGGSREVYRLQMAALDSLLPPPPPPPPQQQQQQQQQLEEGDARASPAPALQTMHVLRKGRVERQASGCVGPGAAFGKRFAALRVGAATHAPPAAAFARATAALAALAISPADWDSFDGQTPLEPLGSPTVTAAVRGVPLHWAVRPGAEGASTTGAHHGPTSLAPSPLFTPALSAGAGSLCAAEASVAPASGVYGQLEFYGDAGALATGRGACAVLPLCCVQSVAWAGEGASASAPDAADRRRTVALTLAPSLGRTGAGEPLTLSLRCPTQGDALGWAQSLHCVLALREKRAQALGAVLEAGELAQQAAEELARAEHAAALAALPTPQQAADARLEGAIDAVVSGARDLELAPSEPEPHDGLDSVGDGGSGVEPSALDTAALVSSLRVPAPAPGASPLAGALESAHARLRTLRASLFLAPLVSPPASASLAALPPSCVHAQLDAPTHADEDGAVEAVGEAAGLLARAREGGDVAGERGASLLLSACFGLAEVVGAGLVDAGLGHHAAAFVQRLRGACRGVAPLPTALLACPALAFGVAGDPATALACAVTAAAAADEGGFGREPGWDNTRALTCVAAGVHALAHSGLLPQVHHALTAPALAALWHGQAGLATVPQAGAGPGLQLPPPLVAASVTAACVSGGWQAGEAAVVTLLRQGSTLPPYAIAALLRAYLEGGATLSAMSLFTALVDGCAAAWDAASGGTGWVSSPQGAAFLSARATWEHLWEQGAAVAARPALGLPQPSSACEELATLIRDANGPGRPPAYAAGSAIWALGLAAHAQLLEGAVASGAALARESEALLAGAQAAFTLLCAAADVGGALRSGGPLPPRSERCGRTEAGAWAWMQDIPGACAQQQPDANSAVAVACDIAVTPQACAAVVRAHAAVGEVCGNLPLLTRQLRVGGGGNSVAVHVLARVACAYAAAGDGGEAHAIVADVASACVGRRVVDDASGSGSRPDVTLRMGSLLAALATPQGAAHGNNDPHSLHDSLENVMRLLPRAVDKGAAVPLALWRAAVKALQPPRGGADASNSSHTSSSMTGTFLTSRLLSLRSDGAYPTPALYAIAMDVAAGAGGAAAEAAAAARLAACEASHASAISSRVSQLLRTAAAAAASSAGGLGPAPAANSAAGASDDSGVPCSLAAHRGGLGVRYAHALVACGKHSEAHALLTAHLAVGGGVTTASPSEATAAGDAALSATAFADFTLSRTTQPAPPSLPVLGAPGSPSFACAWSPLVWPDRAELVAVYRRVALAVAHAGAPSSGRTVEQLCESLQRASILDGSEGSDDGGAYRRSSVLSLRHDLLACFALHGRLEGASTCLAALRVAAGHSAPSLASPQHASAGRALLPPHVIEAAFGRGCTSRPLLASLLSLPGFAVDLASLPQTLPVLASPQLRVVTADDELEGDSVGAQHATAATTSASLAAPGHSSFLSDVVHGTALPSGSPDVVTTVNPAAGPYLMALTAGSAGGAPHGHAGGVLADMAADGVVPDARIAVAALQAAGASGQGSHALAVIGTLAAAMVAAGASGGQVRDTVASAHVTRALMATLAADGRTDAVTAAWGCFTARHRERLRACSGSSRLVSAEPHSAHLQGAAQAFIASLALGTLVSGLGGANGEPPSRAVTATPLLALGGLTDPEERPAPPGQALVAACEAARTYLLGEDGGAPAAGDGGSGALSLQTLASVTLLQRACGHRLQARRLLSLAVGHAGALPALDGEAFASLLLPLAAGGLTGDLRALQGVAASAAMSGGGRSSPPSSPSSLLWGSSIATAWLAAGACRNDSAAVGASWRQLGALASTGALPRPPAPGHGSILTVTGAGLGAASDGEVSALPLPALAWGLGARALNAPAPCSDGSSAGAGGVASSVAACSTALDRSDCGSPSHWAANVRTAYLVGCGQLQAALVEYLPHAWDGASPLRARFRPSPETVTLLAQAVADDAGPGGASASRVTLPASLLQQGQSPVLDLPVTLTDWEAQATLIQRVLQAGAGWGLALRPCDVAPLVQLHAARGNIGAALADVASRPCALLYAAAVRGLASSPACSLPSAELIARRLGEDGVSPDALLAREVERLCGALRVDLRALFGTLPFSAAQGGGGDEGGSDGDVTNAALLAGWELPSMGTLTASPAAAVSYVLGRWWAERLFTTPPPTGRGGNSSAIRSHVPALPAPVAAALAGTVRDVAGVYSAALRESPAPLSASLRRTAAGTLAAPSPAAGTLAGTSDGRVSPPGAWPPSPAQPHLSPFQAAVEGVGDATLRGAQLRGTVSGLQPRQLSMTAAFATTTLAAATAALGPAPESPASAAVAGLPDLTAFRQGSGRLGASALAISTPLVRWSPSPSPPDELGRSFPAPPSPRTSHPAPSAPPSMGPASPATALLAKDHWQMTATAGFTSGASAAAPPPLGADFSSTAAADFIMGRATAPMAPAPSFAPPSAGTHVGGDSLGALLEASALALASHPPCLDADDDATAGAVTPATRLGEERLRGSHGEVAALEGALLGTLADVIASEAQLNAALATAREGHTRTAALRAASSQGHPGLPLSSSSSSSSLLPSLRRALSALQHEEGALVSHLGGSGPAKSLYGAFAGALSEMMATQAGLAEAIARDEAAAAAAEDATGAALMAWDRHAAQGWGAGRQQQLLPHGQWELQPAPHSSPSSSSSSSVLSRSIGTSRIAALVGAAINLPTFGPSASGPSFTFSSGSPQQAGTGGGRRTSAISMAVSGLDPGAMSARFARHHSHSHGDSYQPATSSPLSTALVLREPTGPPPPPSALRAQLPLLSAAPLSTAARTLRRAREVSLSTLEAQLTAATATVGLLQVEAEAARQRLAAAVEALEDVEAALAHASDEALAGAAGEAELRGVVAALRAERAKQVAHTSGERERLEDAAVSARASFQSAVEGALVAREADASAAVGEAQERGREAGRQDGEAALAAEAAHWRALLESECAALCARLEGEATSAITAELRGRLRLEERLETEAAGVTASAGRLREAKAVLAAEEGVLATLSAAVARAQADKEASASRAAAVARAASGDLPGGVAPCSPFLGAPQALFELAGHLAPLLEGYDIGVLFDAVLDAALPPPLAALVGASDSGSEDALVSSLAGQEAALALYEAEFARLKGLPPPQTAAGAAAAASPGGRKLSGSGATRIFTPVAPPPSTSANQSPSSSPPASPARAHTPPAHHDREGHHQSVLALLHAEEAAAGGGSRPQQQQQQQPQRELQARLAAKPAATAPVPAPAPAPTGFSDALSRLDAVLDRAGAPSLAATPGGHSASSTAHASAHQPALVLAVGGSRAGPAGRGPAQATAPSLAPRYLSPTVASRSRTTQF